MYRKAALIGLLVFGTSLKSVKFYNLPFGKDFKGKESENKFHEERQMIKNSESLAHSVWLADQTPSKLIYHAA